MAVHVLKDAKIWMAEFDMQGVLNSLALNYGADAVENTTFANDSHVYTGGLKVADYAFEGFMEPSAVDAGLFGDVGVDGSVVSVAPQAAAEGDRAFFFKTVNTKHNPLEGTVGEMAGISLEGSAQDQKLVRGTLMHDATRTSTANGNGQQLGAVAAGEKLFGALHVVAASGGSPTLDIIVESDDNGSFTSATTRMTFSQATGLTSEFPTPIAGAITDDYWRIVYTIGGSGPSFEFAVLLGIL